MPRSRRLGAGWTVGGLEKIIPATGGVILDEGSGSVAWFSGSPGVGGGTYTSPAGTFSTLVLNSGGTSYTLTETDGTKENFNSSGLETTSVDRNGLTTTFGYSSSLLQTITDPFSGITTFTYSSGKLQSIKDPASRLATFTLSSGDLTAVEYPDASTWNYGYDGSGRMTSVTEPSSAGEPTKITTITYDSAERVGTITRADSTTRGVFAGPGAGLDQQRHHGQPGGVGAARRGRLDLHRPAGKQDHRQPRLARHGTYESRDRRPRGCEHHGSRRQWPGYDYHRPAQSHHADCLRWQRKCHQGDLPRPHDDKLYGTYNSFAEPASMTDQLGRITTYTYDAHGNKTVTEDPLTEVVTYTYSATQPGMLTAQTAPAPAGHSSYTLVSYQYDAQDRQTTITNADSDVTVNAYQQRRPGDLGHGRELQCDNLFV